MERKQEVADWFRSLQKSIIKQLEDADGRGSFVETVWNRVEGGGGFSNVLENGAVIEKGGVNFSAVHGPMPEKIIKALDVATGQFFASGVSIVIHPRNPFVPIIHMNVRYFEMDQGTWWFGGGIDLTPHYIDVDQARYFHQQLKQVCDTHHATYYDEFKKWADDYFYLKHRAETRGVGGIFFDRLADQEDFTFEQRYRFVQAVGEQFAPVYTHLMKINQDKAFAQEDKDWQMIRRSRYVEFNLLWDKGTKFGLDTGGRTESILMSMPPQANWHYQYEPSKGTQAHETQQLLQKDIDWVNKNAKMPAE